MKTGIPFSWNKVFTAGSYDNYELYDIGTAPQEHDLLVSAWSFYTNTVASTDEYYFFFAPPNTLNAAAYLPESAGSAGYVAVWGEKDNNTYDIKPYFGLGGVFTGVRTKVIIPKGWKLMMVFKNTLSTNVTVNAIVAPILD